MLLHKIATYHGKQVLNGADVHAYKTVCGAPVVSSAVFKKDQLVAVGTPPHAQCAACFKTHQAQSGHRVIEGDNAVPDPSKGGFKVNTPRVDGQMLDDKGLPISAPIDASGIIATATDDPYSNKTLGVKRTQREGDQILRTEIQDPMGNIESRDYE